MSAALNEDELFVGPVLLDFYAFTEPFILQQLRAGDRLLDIGCGDGRLTKKLSRQADLASVVGVDVKKAAIVAAQRNVETNESFLLGNGEDIEWLASLGTSDVIFSRTVLHHFENPPRTLLELASLLPPRGRLILLDLDRESACWDILGFPLTVMITWVRVLITSGLRKGLSIIRRMKYPSHEWRQHRAQDVVHRKAIGWYSFRDIRRKLSEAFPSAKIGRLASFCGLGGLHYMVYEKPSND